MNIPARYQWYNHHLYEHCYNYSDYAKYPPNSSSSAYLDGTRGSSEELGSSSSLSHEQPTMTTNHGWGAHFAFDILLDGTQTPSPTPYKVVFSGSVQTMRTKDCLFNRSTIIIPRKGNWISETPAAIARAQAAFTTPPATRPTFVISPDSLSPAFW